MEGWKRDSRESGFQPTTGFDCREDSRDAWSGFPAAKVDSVFATQCHRPDGVLGGVSTQLQDRMIQEASQPVPQRQGVVAGFGQSALWQSLAFGRFDLALDRFQDRSRHLLPQSMAARSCRDSVLEPVHQ